MRAVPAHAGVTRGHLLTGGRVVTPGGVLNPGWIRTAGSVIDAIGPGEPPEHESSGRAATAPYDDFVNLFTKSGPPPHGLTVRPRGGIG